MPDADVGKTPHGRRRTLITFLQAASRQLECLNGQGKVDECLHDDNQHEATQQLSGQNRASEQNIDQHGKFEDDVG